MNAPDRDLSLDDQLAARLLECDEALAAGRVPEALDNSEPHELRIRLQRGLACIHVLQELRNRSRPLPRSGSDSSRNR